MNLDFIALVAQLDLITLLVLLDIIIDHQAELHHQVALNAQLVTIVNLGLQIQIFALSAIIALSNQQLQYFALLVQ